MRAESLSIAEQRLVRPIGRGRMVSQRADRQTFDVAHVQVQNAKTVIVKPLYYVSARLAAAPVTMTRRAPFSAMVLIVAKSR
jgi:hypothetical protein